MKKKSLMKKSLSMLLCLLLLASMVAVPASAATYYVVYPAEGDYVIVPEANSGYALAVKGGGDAATYTPFWLYEKKNGSDAQLFTLKRVDGDWYIIIHKRTGKVLNLEGGNSFNDARFWLYPNDGTYSCHFRFIQVGSSYVIQCRVGSQRVIDLDNANCFNGAIVHQWDLHVGLSARWKLEPVSSGTSSTSVTYYPKYTGSSSSIVTALKSLGIDSSYSHRCAIAAKNNISGYTGTSAQNLTMIRLLREGLLIRSDSGTSSSGSSSGSSGSATLVNSGANLSVSNKAKENGIKYASYEGQRSADALNTVIDQYYVATNSRYARTSSATYCNIFSWDVTRALGAEIPHWLKNNKPASSTTSGAYELNVNATYNWLRDYGASYGWTKITAKEAQARANAGYPTIAIWKNPSGGSGHIAIVRPEGNGYSYSASKGPVIAQAGASNFNYGNVSTGFGSSRMGDVLYYTHN